MRKLLFVALLITAGCSKSTAVKDQPVTLESVPADIMKTAEKAMHDKYPDVKFQTATLRGDLYEITGKSKTGKVHDVEITTAGEIKEVE